ncbi:MAG: hypothetical protein H7Z37_11900 [Pyrinomonadaceae bacterium]|nr:hypothetical protein [Pyrinomonadaceae bacterium]
MFAQGGFPCSGDGSANYTTAAKSLVSAAQLILNETYVSISPNCSINNYVIELRKPQYSLQKDYEDGLTFPKAAAFLKRYMAQPSNSNLRVRIVRDAFRDVYGRDATAVEQAFWDAQMRNEKAWYSTIVTGEIKNLNQSQTQRRKMINLAYLTTMGKQAESDEEKKWLTRTEHFRLITESNRARLYSSDGAKDLVATIKQVLVYEYFISKTLTLKSDTKEGLLKSVDEEVKKRLPKYSADKMIFFEMMGGKTNFDKYLQATQGGGKTGIAESIVR